METGRELWRLGDYAVIANLVAAQGRTLVEACRVGPGQRVLDVAAGAGNAAIPAAGRGASVVATDVTPELLDTGQRLAEKRGVALEWREADAQRLPFADGEFDVVLSCVGAMFAPDHEAVADELLRVCRPGGVVGMANWTPDGSAGDFFRVVGRHAPPPPPGDSPLDWGVPQHVRDLLARPGVTVETRVEEVPVAFGGSPRDLHALYRDHFPPVVAVRAALDAEGAAAFDADLLAFFTTENRAAAGEPVDIAYEYLLVLATKADGP
ncbi:class I SAM-dependent methyltransferase [Nonomuraea sp. NPDC048826]|uniref:class I SAM-dependent methyltransferase n=1 Tax=Nonomuraea sp. NPDC048826 TaxID=3364347 RepID=UPI0037186EFE